jgi:hypothetical protein
VAEKKKTEVFVTPRGTARYPRLNAPDNKFNPDKPVYKVDLVLAGADADKLIEKINTAMAESAKAAKADPKNKIKGAPKIADPPYKALLNDQEEETGETKFSFKMSASGTRKDGSKWTARPALFDARQQPIKKNVGGGSEIKVDYEMYPFYTAMVGAGVSLRLKAVQVLKLVEFGERDAKGYGFGEEEGYTADDAEEAAPDRSVEEAAQGAPSEGDF